MKIMEWCHNNEFFDEAVKFEEGGNQKQDID